jgi:hypothetical protein
MLFQTYEKGMIVKNFNPSLLIQLFMALISILIPILDFIGILDQLPFISKIPSMILITLAALVLYLQVELSNLKKINENEFNKLHLRFESVKKLTDPSLRLVDTRNNLSVYYKNLINIAQAHLDIIALTGENLYLICNNNKLLVNKVVEDNCHIRILLLDPTSPLWNYRIKDDHNNLNEYPKIFNKVAAFFNTLEQSIKSKITNKESLKGSIEVRYFDRIPYNAYFRSDNTIIIGCYHSHTDGISSNAFENNYNDVRIFSSYDKHFDEIWGTAAKTLIKVDQKSLIE